MIYRSHDNPLQTCTFEGPGAPKFHEKTPKKRDKKSENGDGRRKKKREILPLPPFGARPLAIVAQGLRPVRHLSKFPPRTISIVSFVQFFEEDELSKAEHRLVALQQETKIVLVSLVSTPVDPSRVPPDVEAEFKKMQESSHPSSRRSQHLGRGKLVSQTEPDSSEAEVFDESGF